MKLSYVLFILSTAFVICCSSKQPFIDHYDSINIETLLKNDQLNSRAIEIKDSKLLYSANNSQFGSYLSEADIIYQDSISDAGTKSEYRAIAAIDDAFFILSAGSPALLYKISLDTWDPKLVYQNKREEVFFDAMKFWDNENGIAFGDSMDGCMTILTTRDSGETWSRISCEKLPGSIGHEGAFAASNTNIEIVGNKAWLAAGKRIFYSEDQGENWSIQNVPIAQEKETQGIYSLDFYDENVGIAIGGDYTNPDSNEKNLIKTTNGGKTWQVISSKVSPGYRSCIQFIPNSNGKAMIAVGFKGIDLSIDGGNSWKHLSDEPFYTIRFSDNRSGYLAGKGRIAKFELR